MKKKYIAGTLALCMLLTMSSTVMSFAAETKTVTEEAVSAENADAETTEGATPQAEAAPQAVYLTLEGAYKQLENSKTMELIKLQQQSDQSVAKGYSESVSNYNRLEKADSMNVDTSNKNIAKVRRSFANSMIDANNQARINSMNQEAYEKYYTIKNTEMQLEAAKAGMQLKKSFLETTQRKFSVGAASKSEVDTAQKDFEDSQAQLESTESALQQLRLNFNSYLGYDVSREVILNDNLTETELPEASLDEAISLAIANRNEIKQADYNLQIAEMNLANYKAYPSSSSKYISAKTQMLNAEIAKAEKPTDIELDVRNKYDAMINGYNSVQTCKTALKNAEDTLETTQRKFQLGMVTSSDVLQSQLALNSAEINYANALLTYNLAAETYRLSMGVGTTAVSL